MKIPSDKELLAAACHFGHPKEKWNPKMAPYLFGSRKGIHIFDLTQTHAKLGEMCEQLAALHAQGKTILFVSTKQQSVPLVERIGATLKHPIVTKKWIPGLLTNWSTLKRRLQFYKDLRRAFATGDVEKYTKKEQTALRKKLTKLDAALAGVGDMDGLPHALFVIDAVRDNVAVREARTINIPVFGICDSNADPDDFTAFTPANDDATKSIELIMTTVEQALLGARSPSHDKDQEELVVAA
jgi:small subunit ribosomal protein S2